MFQPWKRSLGLLLIFLLPCWLSAQVDYFITRSDTLRVEGISLISDAPSFYLKACRQVVGQDTLDYYPEDILEYGFASGKSFVAREIEIEGRKELHFLPVRYDGSLRLFVHKHQGEKYLYVEPPSGSMIRLTEQNLEATLRGFMNACDDFKQEKISASRLNAKNLSGLLKEYDQCLATQERASRPFDIVPKLPMQTKWSLGIGRLSTQQVLIAENASFDLLFLNGEDLSASNPLIQIGYEKPLGTKGWAFRMGLQYQTHGYFSLIKSKINKYEELAFGYRSVNLPFYFSYYFRYRRHQVGPEFGLAYGLVLQYLGGGYAWTLPADPPSVGPSTIWMKPLVSSSDLVPRHQVLAGVGFNYQYVMSRRFSLGINAQYQRLLNPSLLSVNLTQLQASLIFRQP